MSTETEARKPDPETGTRPDTAAAGPADGAGTTPTPHLEVVRNDPSTDDAAADAAATDDVAPPVDGPARGAIPPYRPHITERPLRRIDAFYLPRARARTAVVIVTGRSGPTPIGPDGCPVKGEIFRGGGTLYEIDLGLHHTTVEFDLPSRTAGCDFRVTAHVQWRVDKPATVVADNLIDIREALAITLRLGLIEEAGRHEIYAVDAAEQAARKLLATRDPGLDYGLRTSIALLLSVDEKTRDYTAASRQLGHDRLLEDGRHLNKQRQEEQERDRQEARLAEYRRIVAAGNVEQFALHLAQRPEDVADVVKLAREERDEERRQFTDLVTRLFQSGAVDRWDIDDQVRLVLRWLAESTDRVLRTDVVPAATRQTTAATNGHAAAGKA
jgi:hypothetical protein